MHSVVSESYVVCGNSLFSVIKSFKVEQLLLDHQASQRFSSHTT